MNPYQRLFDDPIQVDLREHQSELAGGMAVRFTDDAPRPRSHHLDDADYYERLAAQMRLQHRRKSK